MTITSQEAGLVGNIVHTDGVALSFDTQANSVILKANRPYITSGTGAPTFSAPQGSMYLRIDGGINTRIYMNTSGSTTWTPMTNAA